MIIKKDCDNKVVIQMRLLGIISGVFFTKRFYTQKKRKNANKRLSFRYFIRPESIKKQTGNFHSWIT